MKTWWNSHGEILMWKKGPTLLSAEGDFPIVSEQFQVLEDNVIRIFMNHSLVQIGEISDLTGTF